MFVTMRRMERALSDRTTSGTTPRLPFDPAREGRAWRNVGAVRLVRAVDEVAVPALPDHVVLVNVGRPYRLEERMDGKRFRTSGNAGDVGVIPAGVPTEFRSRGKGPQRVESFAMSLDPGFLRSVAEGADVSPGGVEIVGILGGRDPEIERVGASLLSELDTGGLLGDVYADSLATLLAVHLLRRHSSLGRGAVRRTENGPSGGLPKAALGAVTEYVEENLGRNLTLAEISGVAHMSPFHFSRMFKISTGLSPHQYVIHRRVEKARNLLANTTLPLHEVARLSGFTDQSHLAKHFRRLVGTAPRSFRLGAGRVS
jgi:AraC family transcriptional regulator